jgi:hypothetical protein
MSGIIMAFVSGTYGGGAVVVAAQDSSFSGGAFLATAFGG